MHRLFVAMQLPPDLREACLDVMADGPAGWAWQDDEQLHLTLRFIGEVERPMAEDIAGAIERFVAPAIEVALAGVGWFDHGPRGALFARVGPKTPIVALHDKLDRMLVRAGLAPEGRAVLPHITLARRRRGADDPARWLAKWAGLASPPIRIDYITLVQSHLGRDGSRYEPILRVPLRS